MQSRILRLAAVHWRQWLTKGLHLSVIAGAAALVLLISYDIFNGVSYYIDPRYLKVQFWICMLFIVDILADMLLAPRKLRYLLTHVFFLLICLPYINIIDYYQISVPDYWLFTLRILPMVRAAFVLSMVAGSFGRDRIRDMFVCYIILLVGVVYFSSLMFYVEEYQVNPDVTDYWSALWWALMTMTSTGCYIPELTPVGRVLSAVLSAGGLILFPVFTVYIADAVSNGH